MRLGHGLLKSLPNFLLLLLPTQPRGAGVGLGLGVNLGLAVGVGLGVAVGVALGVADGLTVGLGVDVGVVVAVGVGVGVGCGAPPTLRSTTIALWRPLGGSPIAAATSIRPSPSKSAIVPYCGVLPMP